MTHREAQHIYHSCSPALGRVAAAYTRRLNGQHMSKTGRKGNGFVTLVCPQEDGRQGYAVYRALVFRNETTVRRCAALLQVRSTALRCVGGRSWANQTRGERRRQICGRTKMSAEKSGLWTGEFPSATWRASPRLARQNTSSLKRPAATRDRRAAGCVASARRPVRSMPWSRISSLGSNDDANHTASQAESLEETARALPLLQRPSGARACDRRSHVAAVSPRPHLHGEHRRGLPVLQSGQGQHVAYRVLPSDRSSEGANGLHDADRHDLGSSHDLEARAACLRQRSTTGRLTPLNSTSPATASLPMKRSWLSWTNCDRASGREGRQV